MQPYLKIPNRRAFQDLHSILNSNLKVGEGTARKSECQQFYPMFFEALHSSLDLKYGVLNTNNRPLSSHSFLGYLEATFLHSEQEGVTSVVR